MAWTQGVYTPINQSKYIGQKQPFFRSNWERIIFSKLDDNPAVIRWASEYFPIKYVYNLDQNFHAYWVDLYVEMLDAQNILNKFLIEVKPDGQLFPPKQPKNKNFKAMKNFNYRLAEFHKNRSKWSAANSFAKMNNSFFIIMTEKGIYSYETGLKKISEKTFF